MSIKIVLIPPVVPLNRLHHRNRASSLIVVVDGSASAEHSDQAHHRIAILVAVPACHRSVSGRTWIEGNYDPLRGVALSCEPLILQVAGGHAGGRKRIREP